MSLDSMEDLVNSADPEKILMDWDNLHAMVDGIEQLPAKTRQAFLGSRFAGRSYEEIACTLGISVSMVEIHIIKALKQLRQAVS